MFRVCHLTIYHVNEPHNEMHENGQVGTEGYLTFIYFKCSKQRKLINDSKKKCHKEKGDRISTNTNALDIQRMNSSTFLNQESFRAWLLA